MKKRRYRYRYRRRRPTMMRRRRRRSSTRPEVKYLDVFINDFPVTNAWTDPPSDSLVNDVLSNTHIVFNDIFGNIVQGTARNQRIGSTIFVKTVRVRGTYFLDPNPTETQDYFNSSLMRQIWCDHRDGTRIADINFFFNAATYEKIHPFVNRREHTVHFDKIYNISAGVPTSSITSIASTYPGGAARGGAIKYISYNLPVNRSVVYNATGFPKDDYNVYTFICYAQLPNTGSNTLRALTANITARIYYTDV